VQPRHAKDTAQCGNDAGRPTSPTDRDRATEAERLHGPGRGETSPASTAGAAHSKTSDEPQWQECGQNRYMLNKR